jgi:hypothetical protein
MTPTTRTRYFSLWQKVCRVKGWNPKDDGLRRATVLSCMAQVRGPQSTTSDPAFGAAEITALFVFLDHKAHPSDLVKAEEWVRCCDDYLTYNQARQADWHERQAYGQQGSGKLQRNRFARAKTAAAGPLDDLDPKTVKQRLTTMRARNEQRTGYRRRDRGQEKGQNLASTNLASNPAADLEKHNCAW